MSEFFIMVCGWLTAMVTSEVVLKGTKLQTGLTRVLVVYCLIGAVLLTYMVALGRLDPVACAVFWSGCFLSWFGIRSHLESSILLRMLFLLRKHPWTGEELLAEYDAHYGEAARLEELVRGGLTEGGSFPPRITSKGKAIIRIATLLNRNTTGSKEP